MRISIAIIMIFGACFVLLTGLLSVVRDLLVIITRHAQSELDRNGTDRSAPRLGFLRPVC
jgi:hypothetical protein